MQIKSIAVVGAGTMGNGIAQVCAVAGLPVTLTDIAQAQLDRAMQTITGGLERLVKNLVRCDPGRGIRRGCQSRGHHCVEYLIDLHYQTGGGDQAP